MKMMAVMTVLLSLFVLHDTVCAQEKTVVRFGQQDAGDYTHDGFFMRMSAGLGTGVLLGERRASAQTQEVRGAVGSFELSVGGAVRQDLIVHATLLGTGVADPEIDPDGMGFPPQGSDVALGFAGVGATYYLPDNVYLSGSLGVNNITFDPPGGGADFELEGDGMAAVVQVGKEWWVGKDMGVGVAGQVQSGGLIHDEGDRQSEWGYFTCGLLLTATYN
jgi:hypothetical protein